MTYIDNIHNMKKLFFLSLTFILFLSPIYSQRGFQGSAVVGLTLSQIDGDNLLGYHKWGITSGVKVAFNLQSKLQGNVEVLYSQRGSSEKIFKRDDNLALTALNYFELPFYLSYADWYVEKDDFYRMRAHLGLSYGALVSSSGTNDNYALNDIATSDLSILIGATFSFSKRWAFTARYTRGLNKLLEDDSLVPTGYLLGYFWALRTEYSF